LSAASTDTRNEEYVDLSSFVLAHYEAEDEDLLGQVVAGNELLVHHFLFETK
jgi:hypothetical protein